MERLAVKVTDLHDLIGVSRSKAYEMVASGEIPSIRIGKSIRVPVAGASAVASAQAE